MQQQQQPPFSSQYFQQTTSYHDGLVSQLSAIPHETHAAPSAASSASLAVRLSYLPPQPNNNLGPFNSISSAPSTPFVSPLTSSPSFASTSSSISPPPRVNLTVSLTSEVAARSVNSRRLSKVEAQRLFTELMNRLEERYRERLHAQGGTGSGETVAISKYEAAEAQVRHVRRECHREGSNQSQLARKLADQLGSSRAGGFLSEMFSWVRSLRSMRQEPMARHMASSLQVPHLWALFYWIASWLRASSRGKGADNNKDKPDRYP
jgi:hypothetical protein